MVSPQQPAGAPPQQPGAYPPQQPGPYPVQQPGAYPPPSGVYVAPGTMAVSPKSRTVAALLAFFLGEFGAHRFYLGHTGLAVTMLVLGIVGFIGSFFLVGLILFIPVCIWALVDFILILAGSMKDSQGLAVLNWQ